MGNQHIIDGDVLHDLTVVYIPDGLIIPHLGRKKNGGKCDTLPVGGQNRNVRIRQQTFQIDLRSGGDGKRGDRRERGSERAKET